jgi:hypothetical protein
MSLYVEWLKATKNSITNDKRMHFLVTKKKVLVVKQLVTKNFQSPYIWPLKMCFDHHM